MNAICIYDEYLLINIANTTHGRGNDAPGVSAT